MKLFLYPQDIHHNPRDNNTHTWYTFLYVDWLNIFRCDETPCSWTATTHWPPRSRLGFVEKNILVIVRLFSCLGRWGYFDARKPRMLQVSQVITNISSRNNKNVFIILIFCNCVVSNHDCHDGNPYLLLQRCQILGVLREETRASSKFQKVVLSKNSSFTILLQLRTILVQSCAKKYRKLVCME